MKLTTNVTRSRSKIGAYDTHGVGIMQTWGQFHRAAKQTIIAYQKDLLIGFLWLPAKLSDGIYAFWLVVCFILLSKNICLG